MSLASVASACGPITPGSGRGGPETPAPDAAIVVHRDAQPMAPPPPTHDAGTAGPRDAGPPAPSPYPRGPYGTRQGATMPDLWFTLPSGEEITWGDVRGDGTVKAILWASGAGWCSSCVAEVPSMIALHDRYASRGLYVIESLFEDDSYRMATPAYAGEWQRHFGCPYTVVAEPSPSYGDAATIPMDWLIDAETMEIVYFGNSIDDIDSRIESLLSRSSR